MISGVKGTFDLYHPEIRKWQAVEDTARRIFALYGYGEIRTPALEHTELFVRGIGDDTDIVSKEMYTFADKKGRSLTLRPENTAPVMRSIVEHRLYESPRHSRLYYIGPQFRYERPQKGRYRQFHQVGLEVLNDPSPACDFEGIYVAKEILSALGIAQIEVRLNSVGCSDCRPAYTKALRESLDPEKGALCTDCQKRLTLNPLRVLDCKVPSCREILGKAPAIESHLCGPCGSHFSKLKGYLDEYGLSYTIYPRLVRGLDYYVRTVFEIVSPMLGAQDAIMGGGRYDGLISQLGGPPVASFGWALGLERLVLLMEDKAPSETEVYVAWMGENSFGYALKVATALRDKNFTAILDGEERSLKSSLKKADRMGVRFTVIVGGDEIQTGRLTVKNLKTGEQSALSINDLIVFLSNGANP